MSLGKAPGFEKHPEHKVKIAKTHRHVEVAIDGEVIAESDHPLLVEESHHGPMFYISKNDIKNKLFFKSGREYNCPFKGHANYYSVKIGDKIHEDVAWAYEQPYDDVSEIENHFAFDWDKVDRANWH